MQPHEEAVRRRRVAEEVDHLVLARLPRLRADALDDGVVALAHAVGDIDGDDDLGLLAGLLPVLEGGQEEDEGDDGVDRQAQQGEEGAPEPADAVAVADVHPDDVDDADGEDDAEDQEPGVAGELVSAEGEPLRDAAQDEFLEGGGVRVVHGSDISLVQFPRTV